VTSAEVLSQIVGRFEELDREGKGVLSPEDLIAGARSTEERVTIENYYHGSVKRAAVDSSPKDTTSPSRRSGSPASFGFDQPSGSSESVELVEMAI